MPAVLPSGRLPFRLPLLAVCLLLLAAGCRSSQTAYHFRPGSPVAVQPALPTGADTAVHFGSMAVLPDQPRAAVALPSRNARPASHLRQRRQARQMRPVLAQALARVQKAPLQTQPAAQAVRKAASPGHRTEVGLGTTVLGVLGLVVLPIALLGLLIWGGAVWAVLAGLAALAVLVAYLDPFA